jgi:hypothetical protein
MSTTKRSKKDSKTISEASGNGQTNGNTNGSNGHSNGHKGTLDDFAEKKLAAEQYYLDTCERYKVIPDAAIVVSINLNPIFKILLEICRAKARSMRWLFYIGSYILMLI